MVVLFQNTLCYHFHLKQLVTIRCEHLDSEHSLQNKLEIANAIKP
jgi:hypothetical protein